jgi:hypothetical protein
MKDYKPDIDTPTMEASYQRKCWSWPGDKIFPDYIEKEGGDVTANASSYTIDVGDQPAEDQQKHSVIANLAWVVDSGATFDTVPLGYAKREELQRIPLLNPIEINTANGPAVAEHGVVLQLPGMPEYVCATEMPNSPALMSVGRRCMVHGYSFIWMAGREPYFISRDAACIIPCVIRGGVPYLDPDEPKCKPRVFETHGKKYGAYLFDRKSNKGKKVVIVAPLPRASSCLRVLTRVLWLYQ